MKKIILALLSVFLLVNISKAEVVTISDYDIVPPLGSWWTYGYIYPDGIDDFTVTTTKVESGQFEGKLRKGDYYDYHPSDSETRWIIYEVLGQSLTLYEDTGVVFNPPIVFDENFKYQTELDCFLSCNVYPFSNIQPMPGDYWTKVSGVSVLAGIFDDVIIKFSTPPDDRYSPNSANSLYNLNPTEVPYAVTHIRWYAKGVGLIKSVDINSGTGDVVHQYELKSYNLSGSIGEGCLTIADNLEIWIPCAEYQALPSYAFTLNYYPNADEPNGLYWKLNMATLQKNTNTNVCSTIGDDFALTIPCAEYAGIKLTFKLDYYPNLNDPSNLYWKLDLNSFKELQ